MKIKSSPKPSLNSSVNKPTVTVLTPFYHLYGEALRRAESYSLKYRATREIWAVALPSEPMPDGKPLELVSIRLSYELLAKDYELQGLLLPEKVAKNLKASREYSVEGLGKDLKGLVQAALITEEKQGESMSKKEGSKTSRTGVVQYYLEIFESQDKKQLTDEQIADVIETKSGNRPTSKGVASYRCLYNKGTLSGQKTTPKNKIKAVRPVSDKPAAAKKPMSEETKAKLKAYTAAKKNKKLKIGKK